VSEALRRHHDDGGPGRWLAILAGPVIGGAVVLVVALINGPCHHPPPPPPTGRILSPKSGQENNTTFTVEGTLANIPDHYHVWLAVQRSNLLSPKEPEIPPRGLPWVVRLTEAGVPAGQKFSLVLFTVDDAGNRKIATWLRRGRASGSYPPLAPTEIPGMIRLDAVLDLVLKASCQEPPLFCVFPQLKDVAQGGVAFSFEGSGGKLTSTFDDAPDCRRPSRALGVRLGYEMSGDGFGGWGVHWAGAPAGSFDASAFTDLVLSVKGTRGGESFQVGLKDASDREVKIESTDLGGVRSSDWTQFEVPLDSFTGVDRSVLNNFSLTFAKKQGTGQLCIDEIAFA
jgi:hypothetical protein